jgi:hypothetical protein
MLRERGNVLVAVFPLVGAAAPDGIVVPAGTVVPAGSVGLVATVPADGLVPFCVIGARCGAGPGPGRGRRRRDGAASAICSPHLG